MAHPVPVPFPCPVKLGTIKGDSLEADLHDYVREGNYVKVKKLLKKGIFVDAVNSMGQTCLFIAALLGLGKIVDVLLEYGSDANHRCHDGSTPVHAAAFSGNQWILSKLLDEGGDLRVHDKEGKTPQFWALSGRKESSAQMLEFIQQCSLHMQAAIWNLPSDLLRKAGSSKAFICSPSRFGGLVQGNAENPLGRFLKGDPSVAKNIYSFGFGKFYLAGSGHLGYLASLPIIGDRDVVQADDEPAFSYHVGPYMVMTNLMWGGSRVTVKELSFQPQQNSWKLRLADLLLAEQEHSSKLRHPHLLQLMSVCLSSDLEKTRLVYERVHFGSLYSILHERRAEFPVLQTETILHVLLQILDALRFLHSRGFLHRSLSSHAIQIVSSGEAKLCNLEYLIESKDSGEHSDLTRIPVPVQLSRWCSPEIILQRPGTVRSDVYSFCAVLQEALTESPPWRGVEDSAVRELILSGQQLQADARLPLLYYDVVKSGLEPKQRKRSLKLQDIQYVLKNDLKDLVKSQGGHAGGILKAQRSAVLADVNICWASAFSFQKRTVEFQEEEISRAGGFCAPKGSVSPEESSAVVEQEAAARAEPAAQDRSTDMSSELQTAASPSSGSDVDGSLCSFEMNEILASYPEGAQDFLEGGAGVGQALKEAEGQQKEGDQSQWEDEEEGESSGSSTGFTGEEEEEEEMEEEEEEEEERVRGAVVLSQVRGEGGRRLSSPSQSEQLISRCALDLKIMQSMLQHAGDSLGRTEEKLDSLKAMGKQKKLLQEMRMNLLPEESSQGRHWSGSGAPAQNVHEAFSGADGFLHKAVAPPSRDYIPPRVTCQAPGRDSSQAVPKTARGREAVQKEKWRGKTATNPRDQGCAGSRGLEEEVNLKQEHCLPHVSVRCHKKLNLQCQRGADSHPAARREEEQQWCHSNPRAEFCSRKSSEKRRVMQSGWRTEVKHMARRVASGRLGLSCPQPAGECTSESEAESAKETPQHGPAPKREEQQRCGWQPGEGAEPWDLGTEDRSDSGDSDMEPALSPTGRSCQCPAPDEQAECGVAIPKSSVLPQQAENLSRAHPGELHCSLHSPPDVTEEFFTPDYFLPPAPEGRSEPETSNAEAKAEDVCAGFLQESPGIQAPGGKMPSCSTAAQSCGSNKLGVNQLSQKPGASVDAAGEAMLWEPQEDCQEKDVSVADIQDLSSIPCEQHFQRAVQCRTPRLSHAPTRVSTPLGSGEKIPLAFEKYKHCREFSSDSSFCGSQDSSTVLRTFITACEEERNVEIPGVAPRVCPFGLKEPAGLPPVASSLRSTRQAPALSEASPPSIDELPPPAQELLDEIAPDQVKMENRESEKESESSEKASQSLWTKESFNLAEDTESRAHSSLDDILERMLHAVPGEEEIQEQPQGHTFGAASLQDAEDAGRRNGVEESGAWAGGRAPGNSAGTSAEHPSDQKSHPQQQLPPAPPFRIIVLDESSLHD